jgi:hypothetical protein
MAQKAYQQLEALDVEYGDTGTVYKCPPGQHDDLGISCAMLVWAATHPHLSGWVRQAQPRPRVKVKSAPDSRGWT